MVFLLIFTVCDVVFSIIAGNDFVLKNAGLFSNGSEIFQWSYIVLWLILLIIPYILYIVFCMLFSKKTLVTKNEKMYFIRAPFYFIQVPFMINMIVTFNDFSFELFLLFFTIMTIIFEIIVYPLIDFFQKPKKRGSILKVSEK